MGSYHEVYEGFWINQSEGSVMGSTLTLSNRRGAYLVAGLALFVHLSGNIFWRITSFIIFQIKVRPSDNDEIALLQQAVLRNGYSAAGSLHGFGSISVRKHNLRRNLGWICWALVNFLVFLAAGILSSKVTSAGPNVLLRPTNCGRWWQMILVGTPLIDNTRAEVSAYETALHHLYTTSSYYASMCKGKQQSPESCTPLVREPILWNSSLHSGCPFDESICLENKTFTIQSEDIYSDLHLGINTPPSDRLKLRFKRDCAILKREGHYQTYNSRNISSLAKGSPFTHVAFEAFEFDPEAHLGFEAFFYGPSLYSLGPATFVSVTPTVSFGFDQIESAYALDVESYYDCGSVDAVQPPDDTWDAVCDTTFTPLAKIHRPNHEIELLFLTSRTFYTNPVADPWFKAESRYGGGIVHGIKEKPVYFSSPATSTMGCIGTTELCRSDGKPGHDCISISPNGYPYQSEGKDKIAWYDAPKLLSLNDRQTTIAERVQDALAQNNLAQIIRTLGADAMLASGLTSGATDNFALPDDQWTLEVENWFVTMLNSLQTYNAQYVTGLQYEGYSKHITPPPEKDAWMCQNQIVQQADSASFRVLGICCILIVGALLVFSSFCLPRFFFKFSPAGGKNQYRKVRWDESELLEMQLLVCKQRDKCDSLGGGTLLTAAYSAEGYEENAEKLRQIRVMYDDKGRPEKFTGPRERDESHDLFQRS